MDVVKPKQAVAASLARIQLFNLTETQLKFVEAELYIVYDRARIDTLDDVTMRMDSILTKLKA